MTSITSNQSSQLAALNPRKLELILYSTEQCNFRCAYCYEDFEIGKMSEDVEHGVKKLIYRQSKNVDHINLSWFGGEPLAAKDVVTRISSYAKDICDQQNITLSGDDVNEWLSADARSNERSRRIPSEAISNIFGWLRKNTRCHPKTCLWRRNI